MAYWINFNGDGEIFIRNAQHKCNNISILTFPLRNMMYLQYITSTNNKEVNRREDDVIIGGNTFLF